MSVTLFHHSKVQLDSILIISCAIVIFDHYMIHSSAKVSDPIPSTYTIEHHEEGSGWIKVFWLCPI